MIEFLSKSMFVMCKKRLLGVVFKVLLFVLMFSCMTILVIEERRGRIMIGDWSLFDV